MAKNAIKGGLAPNNCLRFIKALSPCGVSATGGRGQIYLAGGGCVPTTVNQSVKCFIREGVTKGQFDSRRSRTNIKQMIFPETCNPSGIKC
jgi:hypothetical protein